MYTDFDQISLLQQEMYDAFTFLYFYFLHFFVVGQKNG